MTTLYVGKFNLSTIGEEQLRRAFQPFGSLSWVRVKEGYAFVNFVEECAAQKAYQAHGQGFVLCGERMVVRWARLQQQRGGVHGANGSDERRFGAHSLRGGRPSFRREGRFCTICRRAGHDTEVCYYNSAARRGGLGGAEGGAKGAPGGQRGDANGRDHRGVDGTARLRKGTDELRDEVARAEPRLNRRDRDAVEGRVHECGGNSQKVQIPEGNGARGGKARPAETKGADRVNGKALVCAAEAGSLGGKRKGQSVSRERSRSRSVTRCSDSRCSCQRDTSASLSLAQSPRHSSRDTSPPSRDRHTSRQQALPLQNEKEGAVPKTAPRSVSPEGKKQRVPVVPETVDIAKGSPARKETRGTKGEGREEKRSGSGVEVGKAGLVAGGVRREERKRKWDMGARSEENGRGAMQAEKANEPPAKRAQLVTPPKPSPLKRPPQTVPNPPPKRLELAMLREEDVVIPRITEWQFETLDDVADDGEITSATRKRPLPGTDLPARLRPIRWRNIGKDVKRGRGWKKGLEILARGWQGGRQEKEGRGEERRGEEPQERIGLGREPEDRRDRGRERGVTGDAPNVQERKESLAPESGAGRKATEGGRGDVEKREERRGSPSPREDTSSRGGKRCGVSSRAGALQRKDAAVAEHEEGKGQPKGSPRVKGGLEQNLVEMEQTPGTIEPASLTEMRPAALQSVQGFEAVPVRYRIATEATERASRFADVLYAAEAPERPPEASGRLVEASESPGEASERVSDVMALPSPGGASNTGETSGKEAPGPAEESKAPEIPTTEEPSGPNQLANETVPMNPTESAPGPKSAEASDLKSWPGPRTPLPGAESGGPVLPADESGPMSGEGGELQPLIVLPSTVPPKRKRGRPPKNKPPGELGDPLKAPARQKAPVRPKTPARLKAPVEPAQPLETMAPKRKRGRPRKVRDPPETDENPAAPPKKLPARRKKAAQLPGAPPEPANAGPPPGAIAGDGGGSPMDVDDLPLSDRVADAIKARGSIHTMGKGRDAGGVNEPAAGESSQGTHSDWLAGADEGLQGDELDEVCYGMPPEQNVCMLVFPRDRSENLRGESVPDPYAQLVLDFRDGPGELTPEMVLDPSAFSSESHLKASDFSSLLPRLLLTEGPPAAADQAIQPTSRGLPQPTGTETGPARIEPFKPAPQAGGGGLVPEEDNNERAILPSRADRNAMAPRLVC